MLQRISSEEIVDWMAWTVMNDKAAKDEAAKNNKR
jgi:hypothetical protein